MQLTQLRQNPRRSEFSSTHLLAVAILRGRVHVGKGLVLLARLGGVVALEEGTNILWREVGRLAVALAEPLFPDPGCDCF